MTTVTGKRVILKNLQDEYLIPFTDQGGSGNPDNETIVLNGDDELVTIGNQTKDGQLNYDWMGTMEEYQTAVQQGVIEDNWTCFITDYQSEDAIDIIRRAKANLPYVLLEPKWFEQNPQNASWLESDGSFKDGTIYTDAYDALATELDSSISIGTANENGYVKRGLPVVDSNDTYTDYDYVINQTAHTFRLPTKVNIVGGGTAPVIGDGPLGLVQPGGRTDISRMTYLSSNNIALNYANANVTNAGVNVGVSSDPTKSGIEAKLGQADNSGLILCFYVGDIVTDLQIVNGGAVLTSLDNKVNRDLTNLPNSSKSEIAGYGMPSSRYVDLTLGASGSTYTAPANGWFYIDTYCTTDGSIDFAILGNFRVVMRSGVSGNHIIRGIIPVIKGYQVTPIYTVTLTNTNWRFHYAEGAQN